MPILSPSGEVHVFGCLAIGVTLDGRLVITLFEVDEDNDMATTACSACHQFDHNARNCPAIHGPVEPSRFAGSKSRQAVLYAVLRGCPLSEAAKHAGVSEQAVRASYRAIFGDGHATPRQVAIADRDGQILELARAGQSTTRIAKTFGITTQLVRYICYQRGVGFTKCVGGRQRKEAAA